MTEDLTPLPGRVFIADTTGSGHLDLVTIKTVRRRKDGTPSNCTAIWEARGIIAEGRITVPKSGKMTGWRRVTLAQVGLAKDLSAAVGESVPTDAVVIVTKDRTGGGPVFEQPDKRSTEP
jgi:hypothetical protein